MGSGRVLPFDGGFMGGINRVDISDGQYALYCCSVWHVHERDRDMLVDCGMIIRNWLDKKEKS